MIEEGKIQMLNEIQEYVNQKQTDVIFQINQERKKQNKLPLIQDVSLQDFHAQFNGTFMPSLQQIRVQYNNSLYTSKDQNDLLCHLINRCNEDQNTIWNLENQKYALNQGIKQGIQELFTPNEIKIMSTDYTHIIVCIVITKQNYRLAIFLSRKAVGITDVLYDQYQQQTLIKGRIFNDSYPIYAIKISQQDQVIIIGPGYIEYNPTTRLFVAHITQNLFYPCNINGTYDIHIFSVSVQKANQTQYYSGLDIQINWLECIEVLKQPLIFLNDSMIQQQIQNENKNPSILGSPFPQNRQILKNNLNQQKLFDNSKSNIFEAPQSSHNIILKHPIIFETKSEHLVQPDNRRKPAVIKNYRNERGRVKDIVRDLFDDDPFFKPNQNMFPPMIMNTQQQQPSYNIFQDQKQNQQPNNIFQQNQPLASNNNIFNVQNQQSNRNNNQLNSANSLFTTPQINFQNQQSILTQNSNQQFQNNIKNMFQNNNFNNNNTIFQNQNNQLNNQQNFKLPLNNNVLNIFGNQSNQNQNNNIFDNLVANNNIIQPNYNNQLNLIPQNYDQNLCIFNQKKLPNQSIFSNNDQSIFQKSAIPFRCNLNDTKKNTLNQNIDKQDRFNILNNLQAYEPFKKKNELDSSVFKEEFSLQSKQKIQELEQTYLKLLPVNSEYIKLYQSTNFNDVRIKFTNQESIDCHRIVLISQSPYFNKIFDGKPEQQIFALEIDYESFKLSLKYMYFSTLTNDEIYSLQMDKAIDLMGVAIFLQLTPLLTLVIIKNMIPKMNNSTCLELLFTCQEWLINELLEKDAVPVLKLLFKYCLNYFSNNSVDILKSDDDKKYLQHLNPDTSHCLIEKSLFLYKDFQHMSDLLQILVNKNFGKNIIEIMQKGTRPFRNFMPFDKKYIPYIDDVNKLKPDLVYDTNMINPPPDLRQTPNVAKAKEFFQQDNSTMLDEDFDDLIYFNDITLRNEKNPPTNEKVIGAFSQQDPDYIMELELKPDYSNRMIISQKFYSLTRSFCLILEVDLDQNISVYIQERGQKKDQKIKSFNFSSCLMKFTLQEENDNYDQFLFYSFANDQKIIVGIKNAFSLKVLKNKTKIKLKVHINEYSVHSCTLHYINSQFKTFLQVYMDCEVQEKEDEFINMTPQQKDKRKSQLLLEDLLVWDCQKVVVDQEPQAKINLNKKSFMLDTPRQFQLNSESKSVANLSIEKNSKQKQMSFYDISTFDLYYLLSSDNLNIDNEKYVLFYIYRHCLEKSEKEIRLILSGLRFNYLDLGYILDVGRDHNVIRDNSFFKKRLYIEISHRLNMSKQLKVDKPRKFYKEINQTEKNFKQQLLDWLVHSDHHLGYQNELRKILSQNQAQINELKRLENQDQIQKKYPNDSSSNINNINKDLGKQLKQISQVNNLPIGDVNQNRHYIPSSLMHMNFRNDSILDNCVIF